MKRLRSAQISPSIARPSGDFWWGVIWDYQVKCSKVLLSVPRSTGAALDLWKVIRKPLSPMNWLSRDYQLTCQSHRVWARPCLGPAKDSAVWCPDGRSQRNGCRPDSWRAGTCTTVKWIYTSHEVSKAVIKTGHQKNHIIFLYIACNIKWLTELLMIILQKENYFLLSILVNFWTI